MLIDLIPLNIVYVSEYYVHGEYQRKGSKVVFKRFISGEDLDLAGLELEFRNRPTFPSVNSPASQGDCKSLGNPDFRPTRCPNCSRWYNYRSSLYRHLKYECGKDKSFQCSLCSHRTKRQKDLNRHVAEVHKGKRRNRTSKTKW